MKIQLKEKTIRKSNKIKNKPNASGYGLRYIM